MRITIESTAKLVDLEIDGRVVPARVWEGVSAAGVPVVAYITRISPQTHAPEVEALFTRELAEMRRPTIVYAAGMPLRLVL